LDRPLQKPDHPSLARLRQSTILPLPDDQCCEIGPCDLCAELRAVVFSRKTIRSVPNSWCRRQETPSPLRIHEAANRVEFVNNRNYRPNSSGEELGFEKKDSENMMKQHTCLLAEGFDSYRFRKTLEQTRWVVAGPNGAAARLGIKRSTFYFRMQKLGISRTKREHLPA
jgi:transcriptional regulator of acetoin/glycerol metabolism